MQHDDTTLTQGFVAHAIDDDFSWGEGAIQPQAAYGTQADQEALLDAVIESIEPVTDEELGYTLCTDGRTPVRLTSGDAVPVREQMVGADIVSSFYVAETLGANFYQNPKAPIAGRVREVAEFLKENGIMPSSHIGCGAAAGFVAVTSNVIRFARMPGFQNRQAALLPEGVYDQGLHDAMVRGNQDRLDSNLYEGLDAQVFLGAVDAVAGKRAISELKDDGRGVYGHVEEQIIRLYAPGYAINGVKLAELTNGREVFAVNDNRMERIAHLFGRGNDDDFRIAYMALEDFADAGHATLAKDLPTFVVTQA
ncbi:MAG TPA: hypothetical protein VLA92_01945 [Candidatus Saccharimonadales bacterium]|nr:hypothetical protein [Candidatus Saccharimonadales bacterium]